MAEMSIDYSFVPKEVICRTRRIIARRCSIYVIILKEHFIRHKFQYSVDWNDIPIFSNRSFCSPFRMPNCGFKIDRRPGFFVR